MVHTSQQLGFAWEDLTHAGDGTNYNVDPISTGSEVVSNFGKYQISWGDYPTVERDVMELYFGGNTPTLIAPTSKVVAGVGYAAINGLHLYRVMGKVVNADLGGGLYSHTLSFLDLGSQLPSYCVRGETQDDSGTPNLREHWLGMKTTQITESMDFNNGASLTVAENAFGIRQVAPAAHPSITHPGSDLTHYRHSTSTVLNYDQSGTPVDYSSEILNMTLNINHNLTEDRDHSDSDEHLEGYNEGSVLVSGVITIPRRTVSDAYDDHVTDLINKTLTKKDWRWTTYKNANEYIQRDISNLGLQRIRKNHAIIENNEVPIYEIIYKAEGLSVVAVDQLNNSAYWGVAP